MNTEKPVKSAPNGVCPRANAGELPLAELRSTDLQTRAALDEATVAEYAERMESGEVFPPVTVFRDAAGTCLLADGFHRLAALARLGRATVTADIRDGERPDALRFALLANDKHGLRRTNADKRRALELAWQNRDTLFTDVKKCYKNGLPKCRDLARVTGVSNAAAANFITEMEFVQNRQTPSVPEGRAGDSAAPTAADPGVRALLKDGRDRFGVVIPQALLPAFRTPELRAMLRQVRLLRDRVMNALAGGEIAFAAVGQKCALNLDNALRDLKYGTPYCVCRACRGLGCARCERRGFQTILQYRNLPGEYRASRA